MKTLSSALRKLVELRIRKGLERLVWVDTETRRVYNLNDADRMTILRRRNNLDYDRRFDTSRWPPVYEESDGTKLQLWELHPCMPRIFRNETDDS